MPCAKTESPTATKVTIKDDVVVRQSTLFHEQEREHDGREPARPEPAEERHGWPLGAGADQRE